MSQAQRTYTSKNRMYERILGVFFFVFGDAMFLWSVRLEPKNYHCFITLTHCWFPYYFLRSGDNYCIMHYSPNTTNILRNTDIRAGWCTEQAVLYKTSNAMFSMTQRIFWTKTLQFEVYFTEKYKVNRYAVSKFTDV